MMLIADSGATKTDWRFIDYKKKIYSFSTVGFSPLFWTSGEMAAELNRKIPKKILSLIKSSEAKIFFYGTGCSSAKRIKIIRDALKKVFPKSFSSVHHDILASARALLGDQEGIACILGTGSNSCYYDGKNIQKIIGGLTYILGDEGSGAHIGLQLLKAFLNDEMPENIHKKFQNRFHLTKEKIFAAIYEKKYPNRFLAGFAQFAGENIHESFLHNLSKKCLSEFFDKTICKYRHHHQLPVGFVGSIAYHFKNILNEIAREKGITVSKIISNPIDELVKFHLTKK
ncbi:MAG TPA: BadF/BadG/BcrA/BcrD ATPase family protein [Bacteroidia bacterium]